MQDMLDNILRSVSNSPLIDNGELMDAYRLVISSLLEGLSIKRAGIWCLSDDSSAINCRLLIDSFHDTEIENLTIYESDYPNYFSALKLERSIMANDAHTHEATQEFSKGYLTPLSITSMLDVPIRYKGEMIGIICCEHIGDKREWKDYEATFAGSMADLIGRAKNAEAYKESEAQLLALNNQLENTVKERTEQLVESEKMAALGNLVAGVAHEVNTPLGISITATSTVIEIVQSLENKMLNGALTEEAFNAFLKESKELLFLLNSNLSRAADLVQNFKKTAVDHSDQSVHIFDLVESVSHLIQSLKTELTKADVTVNLNAEDKLSIYSYPSAWLQIISNLILNSCKHAFEGKADNIINIDIAVIDDNISVKYSDNGIGIAAENLDQVFLPFYTTARGRGGTGLGMSIVYNLIIEQLKGSIKITSDIDKGINVDINCPLINYDV